MGLIDPEKLLAPISDDTPCGPSMEYDAAYMELEQVSIGKPAKMHEGREVQAAEPPNWSRTSELCIDLFSQTLDLRVAVLLARAALEADGLAGLRDGLLLVHGLLESFWEGVHPELDPDDDDDPTMRCNAVLSLANRDHYISELRQTTIVKEPRLGMFSLRSHYLAQGDIEPRADEQRPDPAHLNSAFLAVDIETLKADADAVDSALAHFNGIDAILTERAGAMAPDLSALQQELKTLGALFGNKLAERGEGEASAQEDAASSAGGGGPANAGTGDIRSRDDALRAIDRVADYFRLHEPSSPVPLLLDRAKRLISKDFVEILRDLTPSGVDEALLIGGIRASGDTDWSDSEAENAESGGNNDGW